MWKAFFGRNLLDSKQLIVNIKLHRFGLKKLEVWIFNWLIPECRIFVSIQSEVSSTFSRFAMTTPGFLENISPNIITNAANTITWIINDVFTNVILSAGVIAKNSRTLIRPLGAMNNRGDMDNFRSLSMIARNRNITPTIVIAHKKVSAFKISDFFIRYPKSKKNNALI